MCKAVFFYLLFFIFISSVQAQLTEFRAGDKLCADVMNKNFEYFKEKFQMRTTQVNCPNDSIQEALKEYNHIQVSGECSENILIGLRGLLSEKQRQINSDFIFIEGIGSNGTTIIRPKETSTATIDIDDTITVRLENLTIYGTERTLTASTNSAVYGSNLNIINENGDGIRISTNAWAGFYNLNVTTSGDAFYVNNGGNLYATNSVIESGRGLFLSTGGNVYFKNIEMRNPKVGIYADKGTLWAENLKIYGNENTTEVLDLNRSNFWLSGFESTYSFIKLAQTDIYITDSNISGASKFPEIFTMRDSSLIARKTVFAGNGSQVFLAYQNSSVTLSESQVSSDRTTMRITYSSTAEISDSTVSSESNTAIYQEGNAYAEIWRSNITSNAGPAIKISHNSSVFVSGSSIITTTGSDFSIRYNSSLKIGDNAVIENVYCDKNSSIETGNNALILSNSGDCLD